jgi:hypothetical protein
MSKSYRTRSSQHVTLTLLSGGKGESESASSPFGPVRAGLTTTPDLLTARADQDRQLSVLLSTLERQAEILLLKSYEVLDTWTQDIQPRAERLLSITDTIGISGIKDN